jgi:hypothetical protein
LSENELVEMIQHFDVAVLSRIRGKSHEGIIGEWIRWWLDNDSENRLVFNPAPYAENKTADILFLRKKDEYDLFMPFGVAEIENNRKKWFAKLDSLATYERNLPDLKFALLSVKTGPRSEGAFVRLIEKVKEVSSKSSIYWVIYRLKTKTWREDVDLVSLKEDDDIFGFNFIEGGEYLIFKEGNAVIR